MSSQKGNVKKKGPPKHQNRSGFRNNLHGETRQVKLVNTVETTGVCGRCKEILDWKIKFKKYKPLTVAKKCTSCQQKRIKRAYHILCDPCADSSKLCAKCGQAKGIVAQAGLSKAEAEAQRGQIEQEVRMLTERQRRRYLRLQESESNQLTDEELLNKIKANTTSGKMGLDDDSDLEEDDEEEEEDEDGDGESVGDGIETVIKQSEPDECDNVGATGLQNLAMKDTESGACATDKTL